MVRNSHVDEVGRKGSIIVSLSLFSYVLFSFGYFVIDRLNSLSSYIILSLLYICYIISFSVFVNTDSKLFLILEGYNFTKIIKFKNSTEDEFKCLVNTSPNLGFLNSSSEQDSYVKNELKLDSISDIEKIDELSFYRLDYDIVRIGGNTPYGNDISFKLAVHNFEDFKQNVSSLVVSEKIVN